MGKIAISRRRRISFKGPKKALKKEIGLRIEDFENVKRYNPSKNLRNPEKIGKAIVECLENNDPEGVMEIISIYLETISKSKLSKHNELHRQTLYSALRHRNPTIKTLAKLMHNSVE